MLLDGKQGPGKEISGESLHGEKGGSPGFDFGVRAEPQPRLVFQALDQLFQSLRQRIPHHHGASLFEFRFRPLVGRPQLEFLDSAGQFVALPLRVRQLFGCGLLFGNSFLGAIEQLIDMFQVRFMLENVLLNQLIQFAHFSRSASPD
jgi:hypothetical protein